MQDALNELLAPHLKLHQLTLGGGNICTMFHPRLIDSGREFFAERLESSALKEPGLQRRQDSFFDFFHRDRQGIRADSALTSAAACQAMGSAFNVSAAASAAPNQS